MKKQKEMKRSRSLVMGIAISVAILMTISGFAGFTGTIKFKGTVATAHVEFEIVDYSETWVYKDMRDGGIIVNDKQIQEEWAYYVAHSWAEPGEGKWDVAMCFENIFPCIDFKADFVAHYIGSIPVHLTDINFDASGWLEPYISWRAFHVEQEGDQWVIMEKLSIQDQLHYCDHIWIEIIVHLPQDDKLQDLNGRFNGLLEVIQWNDFCSKHISLPEESVTADLSGGTASYFDVLLTDVPDGDYHVENDTHYLGWCVDRYTSAVYRPYCAHLYSSYDMANPYPDDDWDLVNYIINHKHPNATMMDVQEAIWNFINGGYFGDDPETLSMIENATLHGEGFKPIAGEWCAVVVEICPEEQTDTQWIFIEVDP